MKQRSDISTKLIHFTRGKSYEEAFNTLIKIMRERRLIANNDKIRGGYNCVCFTEAPIPALSEFFVEPSFTRYFPFGVMFDKSWIFGQGGRPVIYQPEDEYEILDKKIRWRHVRYEPNAENPIDFTWEREWRIKCKEVTFTPSDVIIIVPDPTWAKYMQEMHQFQQDIELEFYSTIFSLDIVEEFREEFPWRLGTLSLKPLHL